MNTFIPFLTEYLRKRARWFYNHYSLPRWLVFTMDNLAVYLSFLIAYMLRFNFKMSDFVISQALNHALVALFVYAVISLVFRSYTGLLRHTTVTDITNVLVVTSSSFTLLVLLSLFAKRVGWSNFLVLPKSILVIHYGLISCLLFVVRISIKVFYYMVSSSFGKKRNVLVYGTDTTGVIVEEVINTDVECNYNIVGFLDYNKMMHGKKLNGIQVFHPRVFTGKFKRRFNIQAVILADSALTASLKSELINHSLNLGVEILETPSVEKWLNGQLQIHQIQKVKITDLLGRDPIELNQKRIGIHLAGKVVMVTGAAGSLGSEIMRQLIPFKFKKLILIDQAETPLFHLGNELKGIKAGTSRIQILLADVTNPAKMDQIFFKYRPDIIYHAAAYKHVPLIEENPTEAIRVNVGGTKLLTELSEKYDVQKFVLISTDKAVNPANIMGTSKRICEILVQMKANQKDVKTNFVITRFGNVLGSNGSVIPIFSRQIEEGGPITVTDPDITRYFMTIPEACQLVLEAGFMGKGGEIFEFDMGEPVKIVDLANHMIRLSGLEPGKDIQIVFTGLRPGEKLYEELHTDFEKAKPTYHPKIRIAQVRNDRDIDTMISIDTLLYNLYNISKPDLVKYCRAIVPEFFNAETMHAENAGNLRQTSLTQ